MKVWTIKRESGYFFQSLKSQSRTQELVGPIRNLDGELSNSHSECLKFWSIYCEKLYSKTCNKNLFDCISIENMDLDSPINYDDYISSLKSLKIIKRLEAILSQMKILKIYSLLMILKLKKVYLFCNPSIMSLEVSGKKRVFPKS